MNRYKTLCSISALASLLIALLLTGCSSHKSKQQYLESGIRYMHEGRHEHAILQFQNALKLDPHFVEALYQLGQAHLAVHDWPSAFSALQQAVSLDPGRADATLSLSHLLLAAKEAEAPIATLLEKGANNPEAYQSPAMPHLGRQPGQGLQPFSKATPTTQEPPADLNPAFSGTPTSKRQDPETDLQHLAISNYPDETSKEHPVAQYPRSGQSALQQAVNLNSGYVRPPLSRTELFPADKRYERANHPKTEPLLTTSPLILPARAPQLNPATSPTPYMNVALTEIARTNPQNATGEPRDLAITNHPDKTLFPNPLGTAPNSTSIHATPEPGSVILLLTGVLCLGLVIRRRNRSASSRAARSIPN